MSALRLAIVDDYDLVVAGVAAMLSDQRHLIQVTALDPATVETAGVDVLLYDPFGSPRSSMDSLGRLVHRSAVPVIVYTWEMHPAASEQALGLGAAGYLSKALGGDQIADAVRAAVRDGGGAGRLAVRPAAAVGLSAREAEILTMIAAGLSNQEIAQRKHLSINSVKTYIRTAYRKIQVERRSQAVRWAIENGFVCVPTSAAEAVLS